MNEQMIRTLIAKGELHRFYDSTAWRKKRKEVLKAQHGECQLCKSRGKLTKATIVHHVLHLRTRPDLALSEFEPNTGAVQLMALCKSCHEECHPEAGYKSNKWADDEKW